MAELSRKQFIRTGGIAAAAAAGGLALPLPTAEHARATGGGTSFTGIVNDQGGHVFNVTNAAYGAKADTVRSARGGSIAAGSTTFNHTAAAADTSTGVAVEFTSADIGKVLTVQGAGPSGGVLSTHISAVISSTTVTVANAASSAVTTAAFAYGTDDTAAIVAAIAAAGTTGTVYLPAGIYTILGASNGGAAITHDGRGGLRGRGGKSVATDDPRHGPNTVLLCSDATAGLIANGCARYESFMCDGNNIATRPLQNGVVVSNAVTSAGCQATFIDVWSAASAATGWSIFGAKNNSYYDCGTSNNALDGLYVDGGSSGLLFIHFRQHGDLRYGIRGDHLVSSANGSTQPTSHIRFYSGLFGDGGGRPPGLSTVYLRAAVDWRFPHTTVLGANLAGPTIDLDQTEGHSLDFSHCSISSSRNSSAGESTSPAARAAGKMSLAARPADRLTLEASTGYACIQISGTPSDTTEKLFLKIDSCELLDGDHSVYVKASPGSYRYSAVGGWRDTTTLGPAVAAGLPAFDTLFDGRTGPWRTATATAPWAGTVSYRVMAERWVQLKGTVQYTGTGSGPIASLPTGYRPNGATRRVPVAASSGLAVALVNSTGDLSAVPVGAASFPASATIRLDGVCFSIGGP